MMDHATLDRLSREWEDGTISMEDKMEIIAASVAKLIRGFDGLTAEITETREEIQASITKQLDIMSMVVDKLESDLDKHNADLTARIEKLEKNNG